MRIEIDHKDRVVNASNQLEGGLNLEMFSRIFIYESLQRPRMQVWFS